MPLPASLIQQVERHSCFTGCYGVESDAAVCLDPQRPPEPTVLVSCRDCLSFKLGVLRSLLPAGTPAYQLADELTAHMRRLRGYALSVSGYHAQGPGFWLSAAHLAGAGLFLLDGSRSRGLGSDLDLLMLAFRHNVIAPPDPRMTDPRNFQTQTVYVDFSRTPAPVTGRASLLTSPQCSAQPRPGFRAVTLAEFVPAPATAPAPAGSPASAVRAGAAATAAATASAASAAVSSTTATKASAPVTSAPVTSAPPKPLKIGDICPVCKAPVKERALLNKTFVGCLC